MRSTHQPESEIFVASLADYVQGRLFGRWISVTFDEIEMAKAIAVMLEDSDTPGAEEWLIFEARGFSASALVDSDWSLSDVISAWAEDGAWR